MEKWIRKKPFKGKSMPFEPNRDYINSAVEEYLKSGGKIKPLVIHSHNYDVNSNIGRIFEADDFLFGK